MAKKPKDAPEQKAPAPGPAPSPEELRRQHVETNAKERLSNLVNDLEELRKGNFRKAESLRALEQVGVRVVELALQTRGRLRSAEGRGDAFLEATAANVRTALRHADKIMEGHDREMTAWAEALEIASPALEDLKRISKGLERPGVKVAIVPGGGDGLFDEEGQPTEKAAAAPAPAPVPEPAPVAAAAPEPPAAAQASVPAREILTLGMGPVIDVEPETPAAHPLEGKTDEEAEGIILAMVEKLEEAGVEEGLKRKDWSKAWNLWIVAWPEDCGMTIHRQVFDMLTFALEGRKPISWDVPTMPDVFAWQRKLAIAAGE